MSDDKGVISLIYGELIARLVSQEETEDKLYVGRREATSKNGERIHCEFYPLWIAVQGDFFEAARQLVEKGYQWHETEWGRGVYMRSRKYGYFCNLFFEVPIQIIGQLFFWYVTREARETQWLVQYIREFYTDCDTTGKAILMQHIVQFFVSGGELTACLGEGLQNLKENLPELYHQLFSSDWAWRVLCNIEVLGRRPDCMELIRFFLEEHRGKPEATRQLCSDLICRWPLCGVQLMDTWGEQWEGQDEKSVRARRRIRDQLEQWLVLFSRCFTEGQPPEIQAYYEDSLKSVWEECRDNLQVSVLPQEREWLVFWKNRFEEELLKVRMGDGAKKGIC